MEVITLPDASRAVELVAKLVATRIKEKPDSVLGLATGRTMETLYAKLAQMDLSLKDCTSFNLDEYIGLEPDHPNSYRRYMQEHLFDKTDIKTENTFIPDGNASDLAKAAEDYEAAIERSGGIDLQLLGIGEAGHIGFNEPLSAIMSRTRDKCLTTATRQQNAGLFAGGMSAVPKRAMTMGVGTILDAREIILMATGASKAAIIAKAIEGPVTSMVSASALQLHPNCKIVVDEEAAVHLQGRDYYDFIFQNEPKWDTFR